MNTELLSTKLNPPTCVFVAIESHWHISHFLKSYCFCEAFRSDASLIYFALWRPMSNMPPSCVFVAIESNWNISYFSNFLI